jgi:hypothetical protein
MELMLEENLFSWSLMGCCISQDGLHLEGSVALSILVSHALMVHDGPLGRLLYLLALEALLELLLLLLLLAELLALLLGVEGIRLVEGCEDVREALGGLLPAEDLGFLETAADTEGLRTLLDSEMGGNAFEVLAEALARSPAHLLEHLVAELGRVFSPCLVLHAPELAHDAHFALDRHRARGFSKVEESGPIDSFVIYR